MKNLIIFIASIVIINVQAIAQQHIIPFTIDQGSRLMVVKVLINGKYSRNFFWDTGASTNTIPESIFKAMYNSGDITDAEIMGKVQTSVANGAIVNGIVVKLRSISLGSLTAFDVEAIVLPGQDASFLLGQSVFQKFGNINIDYNKQQVILQQSQGIASAPASNVFLDSLRLIACSMQKMKEFHNIRNQLQSAKMQISNISFETKVPPKSARQRIKAEYVVRYFDKTNMSQAKAVKSFLKQIIPYGVVKLEDMTPYYRYPMKNYIEVWIK